MPVERPYYQTVRQFVDGEYSKGGRWLLIRHERYAQRPDHFVRSFLLLQDDIKDLFRYVEPADTNAQTYSLRILELFIRSCVEIEANFKAIFRANRYTRSAEGKSLNARDYYLINASHYLADYRVKIPYWAGEGGERRPFAAWSGDAYDALPWYGAYGAVKHDRLQALPSASLDNLMDAWCGLAVVLTAQFLFEDFVPGNDLLAASGYGPNDGFEPAIGSYLRVALPGDVPIQDRYEFDWMELRSELDPFIQFDYDA